MTSTFQTGGIRWFYHIARIAVRIGLFFFTSCTLNGMKTIPKKGPLLIIANHLSVADPPLVSVSITRETVFMAKEELFSNWFTNYFIRSFGAFPVRRNSLDRNALKVADNVLEAGKVLVMFPESSRSSTGELEKAFPGAAMIALRNQVPVLPIAVTGTEVIHGYKWLLRRPKVILTVGNPFSLPQVKGKLSREKLEESTEIMMKHLAEILPEKYRGVYGEKSERSETESRKS